MTAAVIRAALADGPVTLPPAARAVVDAWRAGASFGLALCGDPHDAESLFRELLPLAAHVGGASDADDPPPRAVRTLALCGSLADLPPRVRRRCTVALDVGGDIPPGRASRGEDEPVLWRRVLATLHAHGVHDGAIDVAACALASALSSAEAGDPVAIVRRWVAEAHGRALMAPAETGGGDAPADEEPDAGDLGDTTQEDAPEEPGDEAAADDVAAEDEAVASDEGAAGEGEDAGPGEDGPGEGEDVDPGEGAPGDGADDVADRDADDGLGADGSEAVRASDGSGSAPSAEAPAPDVLPAGASGHMRDAPATEDSAGPAGILSSADVPRPPIPSPPERVRDGRRARAGARRDGGGRGRPGRVVPPARVDGRVAILPTLQRAVRRHAQTGASGPLRLEHDDLRGRLREEAVAVHTVVVVDGSSSMGRAGAAHARAVADLALAQVYRDRGEISVVVAAGPWATVLQRRTTRVSRARAALERAAAQGGGTPLADAVRVALAEFGDAPRARCRLVVVSDGCPSVDLSGRALETSARADLRAQLGRVADRVAHAVLVPLDARGYRPLDRTLAPFRAAGMLVAEGTDAR